MAESQDLRCSIEQFLESHQLRKASELAHQWLNHWAASLGTQPSRVQLRQPDLWSALADVVERTHDHLLVERFWQILDRLPPPLPPDGKLPLLGIPILNRSDLLQRLLDSLDHPIGILAIVDNSPQPSNHNRAAIEATQEVAQHLQALRQLGHPLIDRIEIARPFRNLGVAASWNLILGSFPEATSACLANNDVCFAPGVIGAALRRLDPSRPQFLPLLPEPNGFSAFLITSLCWDRIGLFDQGFHPAYCEDLDYRDRLRATPEIDWLTEEDLQGSMATLNREHSATILSDPWLKEQNRASFSLNRLWYFSQRRIRQDPRGCWRRLWLAQWEAPAAAAERP